MTNPVVKYGQYGEFSVPLSDVRFVRCTTYDNDANLYLQVRTHDNRVINVLKKYNGPLFKKGLLPQPWDLPQPVQRYVHETPPTGLNNPYVNATTRLQWVPGDWVASNAQP